MQLYCKPPGFTVMPQRKYLAGGLQSGCTAASTDAQYKMLPGIWSYYTIFFRFHSIGLCASFLKFSLFWTYYCQTIPDYHLSLQLFIEARERLYVFSFPVDIFIQMHYDSFINCMSVKSADHIFRQFLPDFSHTGRRGCSACAYILCLLLSTKRGYDSGERPCPFRIPKSPVVWFFRYILQIQPVRSMNNASGILTSAYRKGMVIFMEKQADFIKIGRA